MKTNQWTFNRRTHRAGEAGQALLFYILVLGTFLLGALLFAFDLSNMWFHRQSAQTAADAACAAGAMDILVDSQGGSTPYKTKLGTAYNCTTSSTDSVCEYANKNGYISDNLTPGNLVQVSFPTSVIGVTPPPATLAPVPFIRVDVVDHVQTFFAGLVSGARSQDVRAFSTCGAVLAKAPIPIIVLHPSLPQSLSESGTPLINILGGPTRSIQVNSSSLTAVSLGGSSTINLTKGGPNFSGSDLGVFGGPAAAPGGFTTAGTGTWSYPAAPVGDPYSQVATPAQPAAPAAITTPVVCSSATIQSGSCYVTPAQEPGCPASETTCELYTAGYYSGGITVKNYVAIFEPGLYYLDGGLGLMANSLVRPGTLAGDGSQGTMFYLTGTSQKCSGQTGLVCVGSNSGKAGTTGFATSNVQCTGGPAPDPRLNLPTTITGNVLLAPCTGPYGDPSGLGQYRGILFFQDRSSDVGGGWGGGGGFLLAGSMYFHECNASGTGLGCSSTVCTNIGNCAAGASYGSNFTLQGNSGSTSYVLGDIIADTLSMGGTPTIDMALNPSSSYTILKASILQ